VLIASIINAAAKADHLALVLRQSVSTRGRGTLPGLAVIRFCHQITAEAFQMFADDAAPPRFSCFGDSLYGRKCLPQRGAHAIFPQ
jgi:hypothetical protein